MFNPDIKLMRIDDGENGNPNFVARVPEYATEGSAGMDLFSIQELKLEPMKPVIVHTGWKVEVPNGHELTIRSRSGLALTDGLIVLNSPGTVDEDFRGELCVILCWIGAETTLNKFKVEYKECSSEKYLVIPAGSKIAQAVLSTVKHADIKIVDSLSSTDRGEGGFGHTGV